MVIIVLSVQDTMHILTRNEKQLQNCGTVHKCNQCNEFPCGKINAMLERSAEYKKKCKEVCTEQEYIILEKAFFEKENNLKK